MINLTEYEDFISQRLNGLGVIREVAGFALQQVEADIRAHIAKSLHLTDDRLPDLAVLKPTTIDRAIQWHKHHRLNRIIEQYISPPAERGTENTLTRIVDHAAPIVQASLVASPVATIYRHIPPQQRIHRGQISEEAIVTAILTGFKHGLQQQLGEVDDSVLNRVMSDRHTRDPGVVIVGVLIGVAWSGWDMTLDSLDAVRDYAELAYSIYQMDIPRELSEAWQNLLQILQEPLPPDLQGELEGLAYNAGLELGRNTGRDFVNEISLIYRAAPAIPWLRNLWPSIVLGKILAPVIIATLAIALEIVPGGQAVGVVALATRLLRSGRLARRLPDRQLLQRLLAWLRRLRNRANLPSRQTTSAIHGGTPGTPSRTTRRATPGSRTQAVTPTPARSSTQIGTQARGTTDRGNASRTTLVSSSQASGSASARRPSQRISAARTSPLQENDISRLMERIRELGSRQSLPEQLISQDFRELDQILHTPDFRVNNLLIRARTLNGETEGSVNNLTGLVLEEAFRLAPWHQHRMGRARRVLERLGDDYDSDSLMFVNGIRLANGQEWTDGSWLAWSHDRRSVVLIDITESKATNVDQLLRQIEGNITRLAGTPNLRIPLHYTDSQTRQILRVGTTRSGNQYVEVPIQQVRFHGSTDGEPFWTAVVPRRLPQRRIEWTEARIARQWQTNMGQPSQQRRDRLQARLRGPTDQRNVIVVENMLSVEGARALARLFLRKTHSR